MAGYAANQTSVPLAAIMTCELLMVYEAVCYPGSPMALMFTAIQIMLTGLAYFWPRACASVCLS